MDAEEFQKKLESRLKKIEASAWSNIESEDPQVIPDSDWRECEHDFKRFTQDQHGTKLANVIQDTRRKWFAMGEPNIRAGIEKRDPKSTLKGLAIEAMILHPYSGWCPGNPCFHQSPGTNLDPHWEKTRAQATTLCERFEEFKRLATKAQHALSGNDIAGALCYGVAAARAVEAMKLLHLDAAELEGLKTGVGRMNQHKEEEDDQFRFQQRCLAYWAKNPDAPISGEQGVALAVEQGLLSKYSEETLNIWARAVAPPKVKNRPGRPRKQKP